GEKRGGRPLRGASFRPRSPRSTKRCAHFRTIRLLSPTRRATSACETPSASIRIVRDRTTSRYGYTIARAISSRTIRCSLSTTTFRGGFLGFGCFAGLSFIPPLDHAPLTTKLYGGLTDRNRPRTSRASLITNLRGAVLSPAASNSRRRSA